MKSHFADRLSAACAAKKSVTVVGIDPTDAMLPEGVCLEDFCLGIVDAVHDIVPAVKPNIAFFEAYGLDGLALYCRVCRAAADAGLLVIGDVKRGDIGSTAAAYARGLLSQPARLGPHDALTLNPYLGADSIQPFMDLGLPQGQGFFVLVKTSNPSSAQLQDCRLADGRTVAEQTAELVRSWGEGCKGECGLSSVGAVVGATHPAELGRYRELMPDAVFLIPGYGAQGGTAAGIAPAFLPGMRGGVVNASRSILQAWKKENTQDYAAAARRAAQAMNADLAAALK